ncbi:MAG: hypothetical protein SFW62_03830 [Alphaproteobacteria bacterium]|nr:hypothetical protein [Alphaproteobacteria bacterium]
MKIRIALALLLTVTACATQRYGRVTEVSETEKQEYSCKDIHIEIAKADEFLSSVRMQRHDTSGAHVLGFMGDFGIGNVMEGDAAELSGEIRLKQLKDLSTKKKCKQKYS